MTAKKQSFKKWNELTELEKKERKEQKKKQNEEVEKQLLQGVYSVLNSEEYKKYLNIMHSFHHYSFRNSMLIYSQAKLEGFTPSLVKGYASWKKLDRNVRKGQKALHIYAPIKYTVKVSPKAGALIPYGEEIEDETEVVGYHLESVFDISQTEGKPLPQLEINELKNDVSDFENIIEVLVKVAPCKVLLKSKEHDKTLKESFGYYDTLNNCIIIRNNIGQVQGIKTLIHEVAHSIMHNRSVQGLENVTVQEKEIQAESVAYIVSNHLGIDTSDYSFKYISSFLDAEDEKEGLKKMNANMEIIRTCSNALIERIEKKMNEEKAHAIIETSQEKSIEQIALF